MGEKAAGKHTALGFAYASLRQHRSQPRVWLRGRAFASTCPGICLLQYKGKKLQLRDLESQEWETTPHRNKDIEGDGDRQQLEWRWAGLEGRWQI